MMRPICLLLAYCFLLQACAVYQSTCEGCDLLTFSAAPFPDLRAFYKPGENTNNTLHVYLEGDGRAWLHGGHTPARNPRSAKRLALSLMALDSNDSLYINRPCYGFLRVPPKPCSSKWWTDARYSEEVIDAFSTTLDSFVATHAHQHLILIGHSGGGTIAMLLAHRRSDVRGVVTIAANLNHQAWTELHGYSPLSTSLDMLALPPLPSSIQRWHLGGGQDTNVPPALIGEHWQDSPSADTRIIDDFDHHCCWVKAWPSLLLELNQRF